MVLQAPAQTVSDHATLILGLIAAAMVLLNIILTRRVMRLRKRLRLARAAAEEAARAAAMAAPGGIDPEVVIDVLRRGVPPTLDTVYATMQRKERARQQPVPPPVSPRS